MAGFWENTAALTLIGSIVAAGVTALSGWLLHRSGRHLRVLGAHERLAQSNVPEGPILRDITNLRNYVKQARDQLKQIQEFSIQKYAGNPTGTRDNFITQVRDSYDTYWNVVSPIVAYSFRRGVDFGRLENEARSTATRMNALVSEQAEKMDAALKQVESVRQAALKAAQEAGVSKHAALFKEEADEHGASANLWLRVFVVLIAITLALVAAGFWFFDYLEVERSVPRAIQFAVAKIVAFSLMFTALYWSAHNYRAHRHNYVANKHRQNALSTFETFAQAARDAQTKATVLLQTTQAIFSPQSTGYSRGERDDSGSHVLEIYRGLGGLTGKT